MQPTLLTLPAEIRNEIWKYALTSPTGRILPVFYKTEPSMPFADQNDSLASRPVPIPWNVKPQKYICYERARVNKKYVFKNKMHLVPCSLSSSTALSDQELPLARNLPIVCKQTHEETQHLLWAHNTLVLHNHFIATQVIKYIGQKPSRAIQRVELHIGPAASESAEPGRTTLNMLAHRVRDGSLRDLCLLYLDGGSRSYCDWLCWHQILTHNGSTQVNWGDCKRSIMWEIRPKRDILRKELAIAWGIEPELKKRVDKLGDFERIARSKNAWLT